MTKNARGVVFCVNLSKFIFMARQQSFPKLPQNMQFYAAGSDSIVTACSVLLCSVIQWF